MISDDLRTIALELYVAAHVPTSDGHVGLAEDRCRAIGTKLYDLANLAAGLEAHPLVAAEPAIDFGLIEKLRRAAVMLAALVLAGSAMLGGGPAQAWDGPPPIPMPKPPLDEPAKPDMDCRMRKEVVTALATGGQSSVAVGLTVQGNVVEIFATPDGRRWTATINMASGVTCITVRGFEWSTPAVGEPA